MGAPLEPTALWKAGNVLAIVCPGQGSQTPGFLAPWLELPSVAEQLGALGEVVGLDLVAHGTTSDEETVRRIDCLRRARALSRRSQDGIIHHRRGRWVQL